MRTDVFRSIDEEIRDNPPFDERWRGQDQGLITCWEVGRKLRITTPELAAKAENDELPVLGWKGGVGRKLIKTEKYGTLYYLAQWQGLRNENLDIDLDVEVTINCTRTAMTVTYTHDFFKYAKS